MSTRKAIVTIILGAILWVVLRQVERIVDRVLEAQSDAPRQAVPDSHSERSAWRSLGQDLEAAREAFCELRESNNLMETRVQSRAEEIRKRDGRTSAISQQSLELELARQMARLRWRREEEAQIADDLFRVETYLQNMTYLEQAREILARVWENLVAVDR